MPKWASETSLDLCDIWAFNQHTRNSVKHWITPDTLAGSVYYYGLRTTERLYDKLPLDTGGMPIQHDLISQLGARLHARGQRVRYLEIGVSVLKCIHTQLHFFEGASVTALDIEDPNSLIEGTWKGKAAVASWPASASRAAKGRRLDYVNRYSGPRGNRLYYVAADAFEELTYVHLQADIVAAEGSMNLVLSDGFHEGRALLAEAEGLLAHGLLAKPDDGDFVMMWDDCDRDLREAVMHDILPRLQRRFEGQRTCAGLFVMPGWIGHNEPHHSTCIFSTLDLSGLSLGASEQWMAIWTDVHCG